MAARMMDAAITAQRLDELMRWHGTDESNLPPPHTLEHLSRDTIAALAELQQARERILALRVAMGQAFWERDPHELRAIVLDALGPPPSPATSAAQGGAANDSGAAANGTGADGYGASGDTNGAHAQAEDAGAITDSARAHGKRTRAG